MARPLGFLRHSVDPHLPGTQSRPRGGDQHGPAHPGQHRTRSIAMVRAVPDCDLSWFPMLAPLKEALHEDRGFPPYRLCAAGNRLLAGAKRAAVKWPAGRAADTLSASAPLRNLNRNTAFSFPAVAAHIRALIKWMGRFPLVRKPPEKRARPMIPSAVCPERPEDPCASRLALSS